MTAMNLLDGRIASAKILDNIAANSVLVTKQKGRAPHLSIILVGNDGASETYVGSKIKTCERVGFSSTLIRFDNTVSEKELIDKIREINSDSEIDGLIVQSPLPAHISFTNITNAIEPSKDVDGFNPINTGRMVQNIPSFIPATPKGILLLLEYYKITTTGKKCVVIGRSNIVGMPVSILLARNSDPGNCTVTICHSKSIDIPAQTKDADIIITALGKPGFLTSEMVKEGAVVIDVGISRVADASKKSGFRLSGDVDFQEVAPKCSYITPVPGGVGPMTIAGLLSNTLSAALGEFYSR